MSNKFTAENLASAIFQLEEELPALLGEVAWLSVADDIQRNISYLRISEDEKERLRLCKVLIDQLAFSETALTRLDAIITSQDLVSNVLLELVDISEQLNYEPVEIQKLREIAHQRTSVTRFVAMKKDFSQARSIKVKNFRFDFGETTELAAGVITLINTTITGRNYLLIAAGILLIARGMYKAMSINISEQDASVFWGTIQASSQDQVTTERAIVKQTNEERRKVFLNPLTANEVRNSLQKLSVIGCVQAVEESKNSWKVLEKIRLK